MMVFIYLIAIIVMIIFAWLVFRVFVRRDYERIGRLTRFSSSLELLVWGLYFIFPYLYNPPGWAMFWSARVPVPKQVRTVGITITILGMALAFGTMFWFGLRRAFGLQADGLIRSGPYRLTRNPQIVTGFLMVIGVSVLWPSWYAAGWVVLYWIVAHMMVLTEEAYLLTVFSTEYGDYCRDVPRYLGFSLFQ